MIRLDREKMKQVIVERKCHVKRTLLPQPAFLVGIEERMHEVVAVVLRKLERFLLDAVVDALQFTSTNLTISTVNNNKNS